MMDARKFRIKPGDGQIVAEALGTTPSYVSQVLSGGRKNIRISNAHARLRGLKLYYRKQMVEELRRDFNK